MKVYVDASPSELACIPDTPELGRTRPIPHCEILVGNYTNNEAEYLAVLKALKEFPTVSEILSDSQLVVNQLNHKWAIREPRLRELAMKVWEHPNTVKYTWIPRERNPAGRLLG